jgi:hypothetical protein
MSQLLVWSFADVTDSIFDVNRPISDIIKTVKNSNFLPIAATSRNMYQPKKDKWHVSAMFSIHLAGRDDIIIVARFFVTSIVM